MKIKDGGFKLKTKSLVDALYHAISELNDSSLASSIQGDKDIETAKELVDVMKQTYDLLHAQMNNLDSKILNSKTFVILKDENE